MSSPSSVRTRVRRAGLAAPLATAGLLLVSGAATVGAAPVAGAATATGAGSSVVLTVPTALHHGYRHGAVPRKTRDVGGVEALGYAPQAPGSQAARVSTRGLLRYGGGLTAGGLSGAGVTTGQPQIYLVFMGAQWGTQGTSGGKATFTGDPDGFAPALQTLFAGLGTGGETWSGILTQYCDGATIGATSCVEGDTRVPHPTGGVLSGVWYDSSSTATSEETAGLTGHQLAAEAEAAATYFGNTDQASNRNTQYVIVSPTGTNPDGWADPRTGYCAYHDDSHDGSIGGGPVSGPIVAFTNMPYVSDAGTNCGSGSVNTPGVLDGATEAASHEYAETVTDQFPETNPAPGWTTYTGSENGDLCAYVSSGPGQAFNLADAAGSVAVQGTWSNRAAACSDGESDFTYTSAVSSVSPAAAAAGTTVTISGSGLGTASSVLFGGVAGTIVTAAPGTVTATVPTGALDGAVSVVTTYGTASSPKAFHVAPTVTSFSPGIVSRGGTLVISGSGLATPKKVTVGGKKAVVISSSATSLTVTVGAKAVSGSVTVTSKYGTSTLPGLTVS